MTEFIDMKTNEENRNKADRNINLSEFDILYEFLGNMSGDKRFVNFDPENKKLYLYHNDNGFTEDDKKALYIKNQSGNNENTAGHNGFGVRLAIDRLLPDDEEDEPVNFATVYSLNDKQTCRIGHFNYTKWEKFTRANDIIMMEKMKIDIEKGSFFVIPFSDRYCEIWTEKEDDLRLSCIKFNNILISENKIELYWNCKKQEVTRRITPIEDAIILKYTIGHFTKHDKKTKKKPLYLKIDNFESLDVKYKEKLKNEYIHISNIKAPYFKTENLAKETEKIRDLCDRYSSFQSIDGGKLVLNIVEETLVGEENAMTRPWIDGCSVVINNHIVNLKAIKKCLNIETSTDFKEYNGRPRIENHIQKNTKQYKLPVDKSHIIPTLPGEYVLTFSRLVLKLLKKEDTTNQRETKPEPEPEHEPEYEPEPETEHEYEPEPEYEPEDKNSILCENNHVDRPGLSTSNLNFEGDENADVSDSEGQKNNQYSSGDRDNFSQHMKNKFAHELSKISNDETLRCPCCDRKVGPWNGRPGHIISCKNGGTNDKKNGLYICSNCNGNDTRHMYEMMKEEWGEDHLNTKRFENICEKLDKNYKYDE